jgi:ABC-type spermidine/putrescine transport system permease subunit II
LPLARPAILAGALMAFTLSLDNTIVSSFVALPGYTSWPVYIFSLVRVSPRPDVAAVSTVMLVFTLAVLAVVAVVVRRSGDDVTDVIAGA